MRSLLLAALPLALSASVTLAQESTDTPPPPPDRPGASSETLPPGPQGIRPADGGPRSDWRRGAMRHRPPPPPPSRAAHFRIEDNGLKIDVKCSEDEPTKVCADLLLQILDRMDRSSDSGGDGSQ